MRSNTSHSEPATRPVRQRRRLLEDIAFVAVWIGLGAVLPISQVGYLLLGIPLAAGFQVLVRKRSLAELWSRRGAGAAKGLRDKAVFTSLVLLMSLSFVARGSTDAEWNNTIWTAGVMAIAVATGYLVLRRAVVAFTLAAVLVAASGWILAPRLAAQRSGDPQLLAELSMLEGYQDLSVAVVDLAAPKQVRFANAGSTPTTRFEIASITKALTGLVIADAVERGEMNLSSRVSTYLPLKGSAAGEATMRQLVTHSSGYPGDSSATRLKALWVLPLGLNPGSASLNQTMDEIRGAALENRGSYAYSNLGAATAGQATAAAAGLSYPDLMATRLFEPMRMTDTAVQSTPMVDGGKNISGRPVRPWVMDGLAPAGGVVSTSKDLAILATAILQGSAPGLAALAGTTAADEMGNEMSHDMSHDMSNRIGVFWLSHHHDDGQIMTGHSGMNGGYTSYLGLDLENRKAVIVLSDVAKDVDEIGMRLLSQGS